ncbi:MAG: tRNA pseudouridine(55) synthase TruB [candidate division WOR-3 bacterium]|nr:MAG: tRNA pseudouridine(55) synthase TruB [candidate division WOR-3 bacterium]
MCTQQSDIVLVDKPVGFSSFQIVRLLKNKYEKVGHAGTLDPFASGLLVMLIGSATRRFNEFQTYEKEYHGQMLMGYVTDTYDITGRILDHNEQLGECAVEHLQSIAQDFIGNIEQVPPRFSALKLGGRKMYELSRAGKTVDPPKRSVCIHEFTLTTFTRRVLGFRTIVGKGTYIRSLAHDFGQRAGYGAVLLSLRRTRIGSYSVDNAHSLGSLMNKTTG